MQKFNIRKDLMKNFHMHLALNLTIIRDLYILDNKNQRRILNQWQIIKRNHRGPSQAIVKSELKKTQTSFRMISKIITNRMTKMIEEV